MRYAALGILAFLMGQVPDLRWSELADTVYGIENGQDTFVIYIQSRSGSVRRFDRYDRQVGGGGFLMQESDSLYLDASGRIDRIRLYERSRSGGPFELVGEHRFTYPGTPTVKVEFRDTSSSSPLYAELFSYGLTSLEGSFILDFLLSDGSVPLEAYPFGYRTGQWGDSLAVHVLQDNEGFFMALRRGSGRCDSILSYSGPLNGPLTPEDTIRICHTGGRIDSIIFDDTRSYWSYDANNRPIQLLDISMSGSSYDTTRYEYIYDANGRLVESRRSVVTPNGPSVRTYYLRYQSIPGSLASEVERGCLSWDAAGRRGSFPCKSAGEVTAVQLYDVQGRVVWESRVEGNGVFEVPASLPSGLYYLRGGAQVVRVYLLP